MLNRSLLLKLLSAVILFGAWEIAGRIPVSFAFPTFLESMDALIRMTRDGTIFEAYAETLQPLVVGVAISAVLGIGIGLWVGLNSFFDWLFSPIFIYFASPRSAERIGTIIINSRVSVDNNFIKIKDVYSVI